MKRTAFLAAAAACAFFPAATEAMPAPDPIKTELVSYTDLDLGSQAGQAVLERRIRAAAMRACTVDRYLVLSCYDEARWDAMQQVRRLIGAQESSRAGAQAPAPVGRH
jgi:UrcA family protein